MPLTGEDITRAEKNDKPAPSEARLGFGGGCHWCTEAVFQAIRGVKSVEQGFIKSHAPHHSFSEAVIVTFDPTAVPAAILIEIHLRTHASTSQHKMRAKYRSAIYVFSDEQKSAVCTELKALRPAFNEPLITMVLPFVEYKPSTEQFQNYYQTNAQKPFCTTYIDPKLNELRRSFGRYYNAVTDDELS